MGPDQGIAGGYSYYKQNYILTNIRKFQYTSFFHIESNVLLHKITKTKSGVPFNDEGIYGLIKIPNLPALIIYKPKKIK